MEFCRKRQKLGIIGYPSNATAIQSLRGVSLDAALVAHLCLHEYVTRQRARTSPTRLVKDPPARKLKPGVPKRLPSPIFALQDTAASLGNKDELITAHFDDET